jgi:hypothetical protein
MVVRPLYLLSGGSQASLSLEVVGTSCLTTPDYPPTVLMASQIYAGLLHVGGPDTRYATCQFIPFDPFLAVACYNNTSDSFD